MYVPPLFIAAMLGLVFRALLAAGPYSGHPWLNPNRFNNGTQEPQFFIGGDFEAQRHWIDLTWNLPPRYWYLQHCEDDQEEDFCNDLEYWGLDYPPLTAMHSYFLGFIAKLSGFSSIVSSTCRQTDLASKFFMRTSVILSELAVFFPGVLLMAQRLRPILPPKWSRLLFNLLWLSPSILIIDHGHFQFNSVALGFFLISLYYLMDIDFVQAHVNDHWRLTNSELLGGLFFCFSMLFKQMSLFYAPAIFTIVLALLSAQTHNIFHNISLIIQMGFIVLFTLFVILLPWIPGIFHHPHIRGLESIFHRVFPVKRGLFEDKVANFWCSTGPILKLHKYFTPDELFPIALVTTILAIVPICVFGYYQITSIFRQFEKAWGATRASHIRKLILSNTKTLIFSYMFFLTFSVSFCSFFFGFQVHEKNILFPIVPLICLMLVQPDLFEYGQSFLLASLASMSPLLLREYLGPAYFGFLFFQIYSYKKPKTTLGRIVYILTVFGILYIHACSFLFAPPELLPDLWAYLMTAFTALIMCFVALCIVFYFILLSTDLHEPPVLKPRYPIRRLW